MIGLYDRRQKQGMRNGGERISIQGTREMDEFTSIVSVVAPSTDSIFDMNTVPVYTEQENDLIINSLMSLRKDKIHEFLSAYRLRGYGTKANKRETLLEALATGKLVYAHIVAYLDQIEPWGKQHIFSFRVSQS